MKKTINQKKGFSKNYFLLFGFVLCFVPQLFAQINNLYVEGEGEHISIFHTLPDVAGGVGDVGLDLLRGDKESFTDWRILNQAGDFRLQSGINNFSTNGTNRISVLEDGNAGIGCTNPQAKLSICSGEMAFANSIGESAADKISLDGYSFDQPYMVGFGYETSVFEDINGGILEVSDLYFKSEGSHRWYSNHNADLGLNAAMVLYRDGNLGIDVRVPRSRLHVEGGAGADLSNHGYLLLGPPSSRNLVIDVNEIQGRTNGSAAHIYLQRSGGFVGVGTSIPSVKLHVVGGTDVTAAAGGYLQLGESSSLNVGLDNNEIQARNNGAVSNLYIQRDGGNLGVGTANPDTKIHVLGGTDVNPVSGGYLQLGSSGSTNLALDNNEIQARNNGAAATLYIQNDDGDVLICSDENGQVGIGITSSQFLPDPSYLLAVDGRILSEEVRVEISGNWPDYVFEKDYDLMPIEELKNAIEANGHLPGIPSASEIETDGLHLGDMQRRMMEKVEELTLYMIQMDAENKKLKAEIETLKTLIEKKD